MTTMEILLTGGNGFVGRHVVAALADRGHRIRVLAMPDEDASRMEQRGIAVHRGDVRRPETLAAPLEGVDAVFHLAAMMHVWRPLADYRAVNVAGTESLCEGALAAGVRRFIHMSSSSVYGVGLGRPADEDFPLAPLAEPYALTKAAGDLVVQRMIAEDHLPAVIIRPDQIFGPGDHLHFGRMAERLRAGRGVIVGSGENALPFVYVSDVVAGLLLALDHEGAVGQAYNITHDRPLTQREFLAAIADEVGARPPRVHIPYRPLYAAGYVAERVANVTHATRRPPITRSGAAFFGTDNRYSIAKARRELGYQPRTPIREGVRLAAAWWRQRDRDRPGLAHLHAAREAGR